MNTPWTVAPAEDGVLTTCRRPASRRRLRADLLSGVSAVAFITAALCAQPSLAAAPAATNRAQDVARSLLNLNRAEQTIRAQLAGRDVARALRVMQHQSVYNGLASPGNPTGGLKVDPRVGTVPGIVWQGAELPSETVNPDGTYDVEIEQTGSKAILTWERFDVGSLTTLKFDQPGQDSAVLNRVMDVKPSEIFGKITAPGQVLVINRNGILFTGTSQVNVGGLVASSLDIGLPYQTTAERNTYFLEPGNGTRSFSFAIADPESGEIVGKTYGSGVTGSFVPRAAPVEGNVEVQAGASITTAPLSNTNPYLGRVVLAAPRVINRGTIETPDGQTILVGARNFTLINNSAGAIDALKLSIPDSVVDGLNVDPDLRGAQVLAGADDYFTVRGTSADNILAGAVTTAGFLRLDVRGARDADGFFDAPLVDMPALDVNNPALGRSFSVENSGLVSAARGNITITAQKIDLRSKEGVFGEGPAGVQNGVLSVTTAVNANGSIYLDARSVGYRTPQGGTIPADAEQDPAAITLGSDTVIAMLPDFLSPSDRPAIAGDALFNTQPTLPSDAISAAQFRNPVVRLSLLRSGQTIADAGSITLAEGALIKAPSARVSLVAAAPGTDASGELLDDDPIANITLEEGAEIDVSGMMDVQLAMESNVIRIARVGNSDLADTPLQRNGFLLGRELFVDRRVTGLRPDGTRWYGSPLLNAQGYIDGYGRTASELLTAGGDVSFSGISHVKAGSAINTAGGFIRYADGVVSTTRLQTSGGSLTDIGAADPNVVYSGLAGEFIVDHGRWGRTERFRSLGSSSRGTQFEQGYFEGADAGGIEFSGAALVEGAMHATAESGRYQRAGSGSYASAPVRGGTLDLTGLLGRPDVTIETAVRQSTFSDQHWSTDTLADAGFADVSLGGTGSTVVVTEDADLVLPDGGSLTLRGDTVDIHGSITTHSGSVTVSLAAYDPVAGYDPATDPDSDTQSRETRATLHDGAVIDVSGRWINDSGAAPSTLVGSDWIDGGRVTFTNQAYIDRLNIPDRATIDLEGGSRLDLNSGGYVAPNGRLATSGGVPRGRGGSLAILLHPIAPGGTDPLRSDDAASAPAFIFSYVDDNGATRSRIDDAIHLNGTIDAFGLAGGGTFALRAPEVDIQSGSGAVGGDKGQIKIPTSFFEEHGFGDFQITGLLRAGVEQGATIRLQQRQWIPTVGFGGATNIRQAATVGLAPDGLRPAASLALTGLGWTDWNTIGQRRFFGEDIRSYYSDNALVIGSGSTIEGDPGAAIALTARGQLTIGSDALIRAHGGTITLQQQTGWSKQDDANGGQRASFVSSVFLSAGAEMDVSGVFVPDPTQFAWRDGTVLAGGTVSIDAGSGFVGQAGSVIDVSGATGIVDLPPTGGQAGARVPMIIGSDAGTIEIVQGGFSGGVLESTLRGNPGIPGSNLGGRLSIQAYSLTVVPTATNFSVDAQPAFPLPLGNFVFSTTQLDSSGIDSLSLAATEVLAFSGSPVLSLDRRLELQAASYRWLRPGDVDVTLAPSPRDLGRRDAGVVRLDAPYVRVAGPAAGTDPADYLVPGNIRVDGRVRRGPTLEVNAETVDVSASVQLYNFGRTEITAASDVRFTPGLTGGGVPDYRAAIYTGGDLTITAGQVYPESGVWALLQSVARDGTITIARSSDEAQAVPLSAGGRITLSAANVVQNGVLRAPFGTIELGLKDISGLSTRLLTNPDTLRPLFVATSSVTVGAGSLTSVSAEGALIPYGTTVDQENWTFNDAAVTAPPEKRIALAAGVASVAEGAVLDLSGGGDIYATEFIPGLGGSRDLRTASMTGGGGVYAIVPGVTSVADDPGRTITLLANVPGGPAAGTYTLLPGSYATLPGAFLVQAAGTSGDPLAGTAIRAADGTYTVAATTGYTGFSTSGIRPSAWTVMSRPTWGQYSEVVSTSGNAYFAAQALAAGNAAPPLPADAGRLALDITSSLSLAATPLFERGEGGRGGQADIAAGKIAVVAEGTSMNGLDGYLVLTPETIAALGAESVVLGAVRSTEATGDRLNVSATDILVRTTLDNPLTNAELVLVASGTVTVEANSKVEAIGEPQEGRGRDLVIGRVEVPNPSGSFFPPLVTGLSGDAGLIRVSTGGLVNVIRTNIPDALVGSVDLGAGSVVDGSGSLTIDVSGDARIDPTAVFKSTAIALGGGRVNVLPSAAGSGINIGQGTLDGILASSTQLTLRAREALTFYADVDIAAPQLAALTIDAPVVAYDGTGAGSVVLDATTVTLTNTGTTVGAAPAAGSGNLAVRGDRVVVTGGDKSLTGFTNVTLTGREAISFGDGKATGTLRLPIGLTLDAPLIVAATGGTQTVQADGALQALNSIGGTAVLTDDIGGKLVLDAASISLDTAVAAVAGIFEARSDTGIDLQAGGRLLANGYTQAFLDHNEMLAGGSVLLRAANGDVTTRAGSLIDVSAVSGGNAGTLTVIFDDSAGRVLTLDGNVRGGADAGRSGGAFVLDSAGEVDLDPLAEKINAAGFNRQFAVRSGVGDLTLGTDVKAHQVALVADGGRVSINAGTDIDASGATGGRIDLYGTNGVTLNARANLKANVDTALTPETDQTPRGGQVDIGTGDGGALQLLAGSTIDVSGGSAYGSSGGTIHLRTPLLASGGVAADTHLAATRNGATQTVFEPYERIDVGSDNVFDGRIGSTDDWNTIVARFENAFAAFGDTYQGISVQRGLELYNAGGDIVIADDNPTQQLRIDLSQLRYGADQQPGWLTIRASGNLILDASISDGFVHKTDATLNATAAADLLTASFQNIASGNIPASWSYRFAAGSRTGSADPLAVERNTEAGNFEFGDQDWNGENPNRTQPLGRNDILRTGTGSIEIAAAGNVELLNPSTVIYTAGVGVDWDTIPGFVDVPAAWSDADLRDLPALAGLSGRDYTGVDPEIAGVVGTLPVLPASGGDIRISAGGGLIGRQNVTDLTRNVLGNDQNNEPPSASDPARYIGQMFNPWLFFQGSASETPDAAGIFSGLDAAGNPATQTAAWVRTGTFQQGIAALGGGDLTVRAGRDVRDISLSVVSAYVVSGGKEAGQATTLHRFGGGDVNIAAGGDLSSSAIYVGDGRGTITLGGSMISGSAILTFDGNSGRITDPAPIASTLAFGDASMSIQARGDVAIGNVLTDSHFGENYLDFVKEGTEDPTPRQLPPVVSSYTVNNALNVLSLTGSLFIEEDLAAPTTPRSYELRNPLNNDNVLYLPPNVRFVAPREDISLWSDTITLAPSPTGSLDLLAQGSIRYASAINMLDIDPAFLSSPNNPNPYLGIILGQLPSIPSTGYTLDSEFTTNSRLNRFTLHAGPTPLHADDLEPARIIALDGDISIFETTVAFDAGSIFLNKQAEIYAGGDIINMTFTGENNRDSDVTSMTAGGDITYTLLRTESSGVITFEPLGGSFVIGGPGTFILEAGGNLDIRPSTPQQQYGVLAVGNRINPYRDAESADVQVLYGTGPGKDIAGFVDRYVDPMNAGAVTRNYIDELVAFMTARAEAMRLPSEPEPVAPTAEEALAQFHALPEREQLPFVRQVYFDELRSVVASPDSAFTVDQRRGFEAIEALFPARLGYTDQLAASPIPVRTGDLNMTGALVRTDYGSSVAMIGPGGDARIGAFTVDDTLPLNFQGIFTLRGGAIETYLDGSFNVNSSRVITAQGGDITIFTGTGDIDAGRGKKTASFSPPIKASYSDDTQAFVDFGGVITGSGIGTLITLPGGAPGDVYLIAPRGTVDAGDAGIRASGNLAIVATQVLNATNIQVGGASVGLPQSSSMPVGALLSSSGSQAELGGNTLASLATAAGRPQADTLPSIISVEVLSFGE